MRRKCTGFLIRTVTAEIRNEPPESRMRNAGHRREKKRRGKSFAVNTQRLEQFHNDVNILRADNQRPKFIKTLTLLRDFEVKSKNVALEVIAKPPGAPATTPARVVATDTDL